MGSEVLSLKWNGHKNTFFDVLATAREKKTFCDATIACEGNLYPVHRFVISTCSTYFERILENISVMHPVIVLADIKSKDIEDLLQYMYTGEVKVLQENIDCLIKAGELLKIKGIGLAGENEKPKKQKCLVTDSEERPVKYQRTDDFGGSSRENNSYRESKNKIEVKHASEYCNEDTIQKEIDDSVGPSNHPIAEFITVKEEIFPPSEDPLHFPEHNIKEEFSKSLMDEDIPSADSEKKKNQSSLYSFMKKKPQAPASCNLDSYERLPSSPAVTTQPRPSAKRKAHGNPAANREYEQKRIRAFQPVWLTLYSWLRYEEETGLMYCKANRGYTTRQVQGKMNTGRKVVEDLEDHRIPAFLYVQTPEDIFCAGNKAMEYHVRHYKEEIMDLPKYQPVSVPDHTKEEMIVKHIDKVQSSFKPENEMKMMEMRQFATNLMQVVVRTKGRKLYQHENKPAWFPGDLGWQSMNNFKHDQLRRIIAACYDHFGLAVQVCLRPGTVKAV